MKSKTTTIVHLIALHRQERLKTEKLLGSLLPPAILKQMKRGEVPEREVQHVNNLYKKYFFIHIIQFKVFNDTTILFCDIVGFTNIASDSTANQNIDFLSDLYSLFDERLDNYDVYKAYIIPI